MRDPVQLIPDRLVDLRAPMAEEVAPEGTHPVQVASPVGVDEVVALAGDHHERIVIGVRAVRRERVPHMQRIEVPEFARLAHAGTSSATRKPASSIIFTSASYPAPPVVR